ncbi:MAG: polysaccharide biosynthesis protein [Clostridia bacterium]|nr:polysaccharide biosynthesis protein [Clostridia bacterium]
MIWKTVLQVFLDVLIINLSFVLAIYLRFDSVPAWLLDRYATIAPIMTALCVCAFAVSHMYRGQLRYASIGDVLRVFMGTFMGMSLTFLFSVIADMCVGQTTYRIGSRTLYLIAWMILFVLTAMQRFSVRLFNQLGVFYRSRPKNECRRVMIVGGGWGGAAAIREMVARGYREGLPVVIVDDDPAKAGARIERVPIVYGVADIPLYAEEYHIDDIVIAIPSATPAQLRTILDACSPTQCRMRMMSSMQDVTNGNPKMGALRDVNIADLLCRDEVKLDLSAIGGYLSGRVVLVTGGGGSIGSELCRQIAPFGPGRLIIFDIYENNAYELAMELRDKYNGSFPIDVLIGSVRDKARLDSVFAAFRPEAVFHAAAHKHVPLMEDSPAEAVKNNIFGTLNVVKCADQYGAKRMVLLSTDKAVNPTNVMGATKRATEMIVQYMARHSQTRYMAVRFGNVLGSNGSVIPLFRQQIARGGPVRVTDPGITRYFMTIPEAAQLVLQAGAIGESGNIFVLDMGTPVKILDLARNLIRLAGYRPDEDIKIEFCRLRPGEKLYEELTMSEEQATIDKTSHEKIMVLHPFEMNEEELLKRLETLRQAAEKYADLEHIRGPLMELVPTYHPSGT